VKRFAVVMGAALLGAALILAMLDLAPPPVQLPAEVAAKLGASGVSHPVTAVLLNFRGYDTLIEIAVLLLALLGLLAARGPRDEEADAAAEGDPVLQRLARLAMPAMLMVGAYLLWAGAFRPGGAFQAGAVLAAAAVLFHLAGLLPSWDTPSLALRAGLVAGFLVFLAVAAALVASGALLQYPPQHAGALILVIEAGLTASLGLTLAGLFLFLSGGGRE
jgi:multisubunit Na+/H+ antiporter MnhB subunit